MKPSDLNTRKESGSSNRLFAGASWLAICKVVSQAFSWVGTFYVASQLVPSDYGLSSMATAFTEFAIMLGNLGIGTTLIQRPHVDKAKADNLFTTTLILGAILTVFTFVIAYFVAWYFNEPRLIRLTQFAAIAYLLNSISIVPYNFLHRDMRFKERGIIDLASVVVSVSAQIAMAAAGFGVWTLLAGVAVRLMVRTVLSFIYSGYRPALRLEWVQIKDDIGFSSQLILNMFLFIFRERSIPIILGRVISASQLGLLSFGGTLASIPNVKAVQLLREVLLPLLAKRTHNPREQLQGLWTAFKFSMLTVMPIYFCGFYYGETVLGFLLGEQWRPMFPLFEVLCLVQIWVVLAGIISTYNTARGKPLLSTRFELALALAVPSLTFIFRRAELIDLAWMWGSLYFVVYLVWISILFREEGKFLKDVLRLKVVVAGVCALGFLVDGLLMDAFSPDSTVFIMVVRVVGFSLYYLGFLRIFHWTFLAGLRNK